MELRQTSVVPTPSSRTPTWASAASSQQDSVETQTLSVKPKSEGYVTKSMMTMVCTMYTVHFTVYRVQVQYPLPIIEGFYHSLNPVSHWVLCLHSAVEQSAGQTVKYVCTQTTVGYLLRQGDWNIGKSNRRGRKEDIKGKRLITDLRYGEENIISPITLMFAVIDSKLRILILHISPEVL